MLLRDFLTFDESLELFFVVVVVDKQVREKFLVEAIRVFRARHDDTAWDYVLFRIEQARDDGRLTRAWLADDDDFRTAIFRVASAGGAGRNDIEI